MERNISKIITKAIREKIDENKKRELLKEFKLEVRKEIKTGGNDHINGLSCKFPNGKSLVETLEDEGLSEFTDVLINEVIKKVQLENENRNVRKELFEIFKSSVNKLSKDRIESLSGSGGDTLLQTLCDFKLSDFIDVLFTQNPDLNANAISDENQNQPILISAYRGDVETLKILLAHQASISGALYNRNGTDETILHLILRSGYDGNSVEKKGVHDCLLLLLGHQPHEVINVANRVKEEICEIVNQKDKFGNTALLYATRMWPNSIILVLLKHGAAIGNLLKKISPEVLKEFLDDHCLLTNYNERKPPENTDDNYNNIDAYSQLEITFDYSFLVSNGDLADGWDEESCALTCSSKGTEGSYETKALRDMARSKEHQHLLNHPVITSFLWIKWIQTRRYYNINLRFYASFVFVLTWFVLYALRGESKLQYTTAFHVFLYIISIIMVISTIYDTVAIFTSDKIQNEYKRRNRNSEDKTTCCYSLWKNKMEILFNVIVLSVFILGMVIYQLIEQQHLWFVLLVMTAMLAIREFCQICVYGRRYFYSWENWFEICIIVITALLLSESIELGAKRHLAATVIVLSWIELIKLFGYSGQLPGHDR